jgi:glycosyltransferase involved in cell wall biosynthesis
VDFAPIDVVIPSGDNQNTLSRAVTSVLNQSLQPNQIFVIHNSPLPLDITIRAFLETNSIKLIERHTLIGPSAARNIGIKESDSEFVAFLDADDEWGTQKLSIQLAFMKMNSLDLSTTNFDLVTEPFLFTQHVTNAKLNRQNLRRRCHVGFGSTGMVRRSVILDYLFDENLLRFEDWDLLLRLSDRNIAMENLNQLLTRVYRIQSPNWQNSADALKTFEDKQFQKYGRDHRIKSGIYLETSAILFRNKRGNFLKPLLLSVLTSPPQFTFVILQIRKFCKELLFRLNRVYSNT